MLGIRPDTEQHYLENLQANNGHKFGRSSKFASRLNGRFFVSGITGSFAKHKKRLEELAQENNEDLKVSKKLIKYNYQPVLEKHQREELRKEAQQLLEMEEKLQELQKIKELKRHRDRARRRKKLEYNSAKIIQRNFRKFVESKYGGGIIVIVDFLRALKAKNAICTAVWAISILKKFSKKVSNDWYHKVILPRAARQVARDNWDLVKEISCIWTEARRAVADSNVHYIMQTATMNVVKNIISKLPTKKKPPAPLLKRQSTKKMPITKQKSDYLQFFLTEFDRDEQSVAAESPSEQYNMGSSSFSPNQRKKLDDEQGSPYADLPTPNLKQQARYLTHQTSSSRLLHEAGESVHKQRRIDPNDKRFKKIIKKHEKIINEMEEEQKRRAELVEQSRQRALELARINKLKEETIKQQKEQEILAYKKKLEEESKQRAKMILAIQEEKRKKQEKLEKEQALMKQELKLMYQEDFLEQRLYKRQLELKRMKVFQYHSTQLTKETEKRKGFASHNNNSERPQSSSREPTETSVDPEEKKKQAERLEAIKRYRQQLQARIKAKQMEDIQNKKKENMEKQKKKDKLIHLLDHYQDQLESHKQQILKKKRQDKILAKQQKLQEINQQHLLQAEEGQEEGQQLQPNDNQPKVSFQEENQRRVDSFDSEDESDEENAGFHPDHVISSAREEFNDPIDNFEFEDFIEQSLIQLYSGMDQNDLNNEDDREDNEEVNGDQESDDSNDEQDLYEDQSEPFQSSIHAPQPFGIEPEPRLIASQPPGNQLTIEPPILLNENQISSYKPKVKTTKGLKTIAKELKNTPYYSYYKKLNPDQDSPISIEKGKKPKKNLNLKKKKTLKNTQSEGVLAKHSMHSNPNTLSMNKSDKTLSLTEEKLSKTNELLEMIERAKKKILESNDITIAKLSAANNINAQQLPKGNDNKPLEPVTPAAKEGEITLDSYLGVSMKNGASPPPAHLNLSTLPGPLNPAFQLPMTNGLPTLLFHAKTPPKLPNPPASLDNIRSRYPGLINEANAISNQTKKPLRKKSKPSILPVTSEAFPLDKNNSKIDKPVLQPAKQSILKGKFSNIKKDSIPISEDSMKVSMPSITSVNKRYKNAQSTKEDSSKPKGFKAEKDIKPKEKKVSVDEEDLDSAPSSAPSSAPGNHVRNKIHQFDNYESQLQDDYNRLREQFQQKLQQASVIKQQQSPTPSTNDIDDHSSTKDNLVSKSITEHYLENTGKISTKDLLMEWAMEDALDGPNNEDGSDLAEVENDALEEQKRAMAQQAKKLCYDLLQEDQDFEEDELDDSASLQAKVQSSSHVLPSPPKNNSYDQYDEADDQSEENDSQSDENNQPVAQKTQAIEAEVDDNDYGDSLSEKWNQSPYRNGYYEEEEGDEEDEEEEMNRIKQNNTIKSYWERLLACEDDTMINDRCNNMIQMLNSKMVEK